jgi:hypothetical protein
MMQGKRNGFFGIGCELKPVIDSVPYYPDNLTT